MSLHSTEGIVLQVIKYQEHDQILSVFTPNSGLIKIFASGAALSKTGLRGTHLGLTKVEIIYSQGKSDLHKGREISLLCPYLHLRQNASTLDAALEMAKAMLTSQLPYKPAQDLYRLFVFYLDKLKGFALPETLTASFLMKILKHEGLLHLSSICSTCQAPIKELCLYEGECYCSEHAPLASMCFNEEESLLLYIVTHTRSFHELLTLHLDHPLKQKVVTLLDEAYMKFTHRE